MSSTSRGNPSMGDILRTTIVLGLILVGLFAAGKLLFTVEPENPTSDVDYLLAASGVENSAGFDPLVVPKLDEGWRATVAKFDGNSWRFVITRDKEFYSFEQVRMGEREFLLTSGITLKDDATVDFDGTTWRIGSDESGNPAYLRDDSGFMYAVTSNAKRADIEAYMASLVPFSTVSD